MNGINKITDRIAAEAQAEIDQMLADTAEKCQTIKDSYDKLAQEEYWRIIREGKAESQLQMQRFAGAASMEAKKNILSMKQDAVAKVLNVAVDRICSLPEREYVSFLARLAGEAAFTGTEELIFNQNDKSAVGRAVTREANDILRKRGLSQGLTVSSQTGSFKGGLMVKQGDIEVNCCVEKLVELCKDKLASQIAEILFAE